MTQGQPANSGELSSFLHLTGWRPLVLALVAGLAGAYGLFLALDEPVQWQARYVLNASRIADDDLTPQELDIFVEEIAQTARLPQVEDAVQERLNLVIEDDYEITVNHSGSSAQFVDVNVVAEDPTDAQNVAIETSIEAMTITLNEILGGRQASADQIQEQIDIDEARITELTIEAGGFTPTVAYDLTVDAVIQRRLDERNPPTEPCVLDDGTQATCEVELTGPNLEELEAEATRLAPIEREFTNLDANVQAASQRLSDRNDSIRDAQAALISVENERENQLILDEVVTEETSRIAGLLTGAVIFALPAALAIILLFTVFDLLRRKPAIDEYDVPAFDAAGSLEAGDQRALPEASITPLTVVDEDEQLHVEEFNVLVEEDDEFEYYDEDAEYYDDEDDESEIYDEDEDPRPPKRSKNNRWGRDAGGKAS